MRRKQAVQLFLTLTLVFITLTGCWSSKEIEDLGLIIATAVDLETNEQDTGNVFKLTNQLVTAETANNATNGGQAQVRPYKNITETGDAVIPALRNMVLQSDKRAFGEHAKIVVLGEELARSYNLEQVLDFFRREQELRPSTLFVIAEGNASKTLESAEPTVIPAIQLVEMIQGADRTTKILTHMPMAKIEGLLNSGNSFLLQSVAAEKNGRKLSGAAMIDGKTKTLRAFLDDKEVEGVTWIKGKGKGGLVNSYDEETRQPIVYESMSMKSKIKPSVNKGSISFTVKIETEGRIAEQWDINRKSFDEKNMKKAEKATEKEIRRLAEKVLEKTQKEYKMDVLGFGKSLQISYPQEWNKVKNNWDATFSEVPVKFIIDVSIKEMGTSG
ncbi:MULTISPECIES: Ger(x)C family spore germination protein [unclassified Cytobacillus]|uniref:Ger(x)C family spore germination protein n=1 Tax=unclassified Cytobacillus TaxID=2675268 RepID=UPI0013571FBE|nr:Ger(x)C family spore germination protein [Cytobacillus sp. AMY 15.2]KAF0817305.1 Nutrient germinant receptor hydrophilic subunit C (GerKC/GerAC/GerBC) [Bacillus sp. ZZV12-4809]MCM3092778.1 Ger(x)C family spore germination protein [Cytobacillus sp. AMY 15.2]